MSVLSVATRNVVKRLAADWLTITAAFITILLATALLASGPVYADAVAVSALQRSLADAPPSDSNATISIKVFPGDFADVDRVVRDTVAVTPPGADLFAQIDADAYEIVGESTGDLTALATIRFMEGIETRAELVSGRWPSVSAAPFEVAVNGPAASALGVAVGDRIDLVNRRDSSVTSTVVVVGIYTANSPNDTYWFDDPLSLLGVVDSASFRSYGPFIVTSQTIFEEFTPVRTNATWRVLPDFTRLSVDEVNQAEEAYGTLSLRLNSALAESADIEPAGASAFSVDTSLPSLLAGLDRSLTITRSSVLALLIQLAILAGYALVLTAGLLVDTRRAETTLLRSRGTSPSQILATATLEGLLLTVPAVIVGPFLASWLLRLLNHVGPLARIDLQIVPVPNVEAFALAALAAVLSVIALAWPAYRSARAFPGSVARHQRQSRRSTVQRLGVDLALVALTVLAFWQLQVIGPQISATVRGRFGVDPLLVVAPALGLLAGAILALRIVPLLARLAEWAAVRGKSTVAALASWQVARRPARYARSSLLLLMSIGIGFFAAAYSTTWIASQRDQGADRVGAEFSVIPNQAVGAPLDDTQLVAAHESISGVTSSMPVIRISGSLSSIGGPGQFVILDAAKAAELVTIREDLAPDFAGLMDKLVEARPSMKTVDLPGEPVALVVGYEAIELIPEDAEQCGPEPIGPETCFEARLRLVIQDGNDQLHRIDVGTLIENEGVQSLRVELGSGSALPTYPLRLVSIEIESQLPEGSSREVNLTLGPVTTVQPDGSLVDLDAEPGWDEWQPGVGQAVGAQIAPDVTRVDDGVPGTVALSIETGLGFSAPPAYFVVRPIGTNLPETFPVVVSSTFPETNFAGVGDEVRLPPLRIDADTAVVAGTIVSFPTIDPGRGETIIVDLPTYQMMGYEPGFGLGHIDSYWLAGDGDAESTVAALESPPLSSFVVESQAAVIAGLESDPVALGTIGALTVGFVAAAVFAAVGFAVSATVSARERLVEFGLLRALGLTPGQLGRWLTLEQGALVLVSLALGTLVGWLLTAVLLPMVSLTQDGGLARPPVVVMYPWSTIMMLELAVVVALGIVVTGLTLALRRTGLGSLLRLGED